MHRANDSCSLLARLICALIAGGFAAGAEPRAAYSAEDGSPKLEVLAARAIGEDDMAAKDAITQLRAAGPAGLNALLAANRQTIGLHRIHPMTDGNWTKIAGAIDAVAAQKDAWASGLYWYTDFDAAKRAARASGKPILSLRLLGRLDTEFSCANSRFFRTVLYANEGVSKALSERFILHWQSVRPVPKVTIDFGDGRIVERTITGNSIHYILDAEGNVVDALPGLYGPKAFLAQLESAEAVEKRTRHSAQAQMIQRQWHAGRAEADLVQWQQDLEKSGWREPMAANGGGQEAKGITMPTGKRGGNRGETVAVGTSGSVNPTGAPAAPSAVAAAPRANSKFALEGVWVAALLPDAKELQDASTDEMWAKIAGLHAEDAALDDSSKALMVSKNPTAARAGRVARTKLRVEDPLLKVVPNFERSIAQDSVRNEYTFHRQIHLWLAEGKLPDGKDAASIDALNERVYADLFLTPSTDPWLGLLPANTYSALPNDGLCTSK